MPPQFKNMDELNAYLSSLEQKVQNLEEQNKKLQNYLLTMGSDAQKLLPKSSLLSQNFLQRAFAIWGHNFVAQLIISIPIVCIYLFLLYTVLRNSLSLIPQSIFSIPTYAFPTSIPFSTTPFFFPTP